MGEHNNINRKLIPVRSQLDTPRLVTKKYVSLVIRRPLGVSKCVRSFAVFCPSCIYRHGANEIKATINT